MQLTASDLVFKSVSKFANQIAFNFHEILCNGDRTVKGFSV